MKRVVAALLVKDKKILVARRASGQSNEGKWEFPGGKIEEGETPEESLAREIVEEFGMNITVGAYFSTNVFAYKDFTIVLLAYFAIPTNEIQFLTVHDQIQWVTPEEMLELDFSAADVPFVEKLQSFFPEE